MRRVTADHYFSSDPAAPARERQIEFDAGDYPVRLTAASGVFAAGRLDAGTALLLRKAPLPDAGTTGPLLDLGCGYGPIAVALALAAPEATVYAVDVNRRALDLVRRNAAANGAANIVAAEPDEVPAELTFQQIWSNPPIRVGKEELHGLLLRWLPRLAGTGTGWLVVARHLGADSLQQWLTGQGLPTTRHASGKGYRILSVDGGKSRDWTPPRQHNP
jgi:16S rRNA (guanine1207-N2)-methyltransferase